MKEPCLIETSPRTNWVGLPVYSNSKCIKSWRVDGAYAASFGSSSSGVPNPGTFGNVLLLFPSLLHSIDYVTVFPAQMAVGFGLLHGFILRMATQ